MIQDKRSGALRALLVGTIVVALSLLSLAVPAAEPGDSGGASTLHIPTDVGQETTPVQQLDLYLTGFYLDPSRPDLPAPVDPEPEPYGNLPDPEVPQVAPSAPPTPGLSPSPMPQPAEPGLPPPPMPQPAEPPPLSQLPEPHPSVPSAPEQEPASPSPTPESEPIAYEQENN